jgi:hypothetical protein
MPHTQESPADLGRSLRFAAEVARMTLESSLDYVAPEDRAEVAERLLVSVDGLHRLLQNVEPTAGQLPSAVRFAAEVAALTLDRAPLLLADLNGELERLQSNLYGLHRLLRTDRPESVNMDLRFGALNMDLRFGAFVSELARDCVMKLETPADRATREALADRLQPMLYGLYELLREARESAGQLPDGGHAVSFAYAVAGMTLDRVPLLRGDWDADDADTQTELADNLASSLAGLHRYLYNAADDAFNELAKPRAVLASVEANRAPLRNPLQAPAAVG